MIKEITANFPAIGRAEIAKQRVKQIKRLRKRMGGVEKEMWILRIKTKNN